MFVFYISLLLICISFSVQAFVKSAHLPCHTKIVQNHHYKFKFDNVRGGFFDKQVLKGLKATASPDSLFNSLFIGVSGSSVVWKVTQYLNSLRQGKETDKKPLEVKSLQWKFLIVFWLLRMADWLQGPYFYEVYSSKIINGLPVTLDIVSKLFLVGFAITGIFGPFIGKIVDQRGRKLGTFAYSLLYCLAALSTTSNNLWILMLGRIAGGLGTSLLFSAPEAWLVGEHQKQKHEGKWLGQTFGWAYSGDAIVAIAAGQIASFSADKSGPVGPFLTSIIFLISGALLALGLWNENIAPKSENKPEKEIVKGGMIGEALSEMMKDKRILLVGGIQALFEAAMYIFVLQWPPLVKDLILKASWATGNVAIPYGKIFSCFMGCCLFGASVFNYLQSKFVAIETSTAVMLFFATLSMGLATTLSAGATSVLGFNLGVSGMGALGLLIGGLFLFEACVGIYFPSIGLLRSKYLPDSYRGVMMNLFGLPLNLLVVSVFLSIKALGVQGALACSTTALGIALTLILALMFSNKRDSLETKTNSKI